jgi:hypothetical protein
MAAPTDVRKKAQQVKHNNLNLLAALIATAVFNPTEASSWFLTIDRTRSLDSQERLKLMLETFQIRGRDWEPKL